MQYGSALQGYETFGFSEDILWSLSLNAVNAALISPEEKKALITKMREGFAAAQEE